MQAEFNDESVKEFNEGSLREIAKEIVERRQGLKVHWITYISVNIFLYILNMMTFPAYRWHLWALLGWGIGIMIHSFSYITFRKGAFGNSGSELMWYHVFTYIIISLFLYWIDTGFINTISWAIWPIGCWGFAVLIHYYTYSSMKPKKNEDSNKSFVEREIEKELSKIRSR